MTIREGRPIQMSHRQLVWDFLRRYVGSLYGLTNALLGVAAIAGILLAFYLDLGRFDLFLVPFLIVCFLVSAYFPFASFAKEATDREAALQQRIAAVEQEREELRDRVRQAEDRTPRIAVGFLGPRGLRAETTLRVKPLPPPDDFEPVLEEKRREALQKIADWPDLGPKPQLGKGGKVSAAAVSWWDLAGPREEYLQAVDDYIAAYREFFAKLRHYNIATDRVRFLSFGVDNDGPVALRDIDLWITLPLGLRRADGEEIEACRDEAGEYEPKPPDPPDPPPPPGPRSAGSAFEFDLGSAARVMVPDAWRELDSSHLIQASRSYFAAESGPVQAPPVTGPHYEDTEEGTVVHFGIQGINPGLAEHDLRLVAVWLGAVTKDSTVELEATASAETLPKRHETRLRLTVAIEQSS